MKIYLVGQSVDECHDHAGERYLDTRRAFSRREPALEEMKRLLRDEAPGQSLGDAVDWHEAEGAITGTVTGEDGSEFYAFVHEVELED